MSDFLASFLEGREPSASESPTLPGLEAAKGAGDDGDSGDSGDGSPSSPRSSMSPEAQAVLDAGMTLWRHYHEQPGANPDASYYDIRAHFQGFKPNGYMNPDSADETYTALVGALRAAEKALAAKLAPKVFEHGFLR